MKNEEEMKKKERIIYVSIIIVLATALTVVGAGYLGYLLSPYSQNQTPISPTVEYTPGEVITPNGKQDPNKPQTGESPMPTETMPPAVDTEDHGTSEISKENNIAVNAVGEVVGKTEMEAKAFLERQGYSMRVARRDGEEYILTSDYVEKRINITIENGKVTSFYAG